MKHFIKTHIKAAAALIGGFVLALALGITLPLTLPRDEKATPNTSTAVTTPEGNWIDYYDTSISDNWATTTTLGQTEDTAIEISTPEQLAKLAYDVNSLTGSLMKYHYYKLTQNINLSEHYWTPIGDVSSDYRKFIGSFDGQGHTITEMNILGAVSYAGLFGRVSSSSVPCEIKNLGLIDIEINVSSSKACEIGGIVGYAEQSSLTIANCYSTGSVRGRVISGDVYVGGIAGRFSGTIVNSYNTCSINGEASSTTYVGGLVGRECNCNSGFTLEIINCYNLGSIYGNGISDTLSVYVGGIVGIVPFLTITNCYNAGSVSGAATSCAVFTGGIVGAVNFSKSSNIVNCYNAGTVRATSSSSSAYTAGIVGDVYDHCSFSYSSSPISSMIVNCYNNGSVSAKGSYGIIAGGIAGRAYYTGSYSTSLTITNCYNSSSVSATGKSSIYVGGIAGEVDLSKVLSIANCYNAGSVSGKCTETTIYRLYVGGIAGCAYSSSSSSSITLTNCYYDSIIDSAQVENPPKKAIGYKGGSGNFTIIYAGKIDGLTEKMKIQDNYNKYSSDHNFGSFADADAGSGNAFWTESLIVDKDSEPIDTKWDFDNTWMIDSGLNKGMPFMKYALKYYQEYQKQIDVCWVLNAASFYAAGSGDGTNESQAILIENAEQLAKLASDVNSGNLKRYVYVKLLNNIDLSGKIWTPIGDDTNFFVGTFDGQGYTILNYNLAPTDSKYYGLFGYVGSLTQNGNITEDKDKSNIKNLNVKAEVNLAAKNIYFGGIVSRAVSCNLVNLSSNIKAKFTDFERLGAGGIVEQFDATSESTVARINNCTSSGSITAVSGQCEQSSVSLGGCVAGVGDFVDCQMSESINYMSLEIDLTKAESGLADTGGMMGPLTFANRIKIDKCINNGDITIALNKGVDLFGNGVIISGMISGIGTGEVSNAINNGDIQVTSLTAATDDSIIIGGICYLGSTFINCVNSGNISTNLKNGLIGGIAGQAESVENCYAECEITMNGGMFGGLIGSASKFTIKNSGFNGRLNYTGEVNSSESNAIGGFIGKVEDSDGSIITNSYAVIEGKISLKDMIYVLGDFGMVSGTRPEIFNSYSCISVQTSTDNYIDGAYYSLVADDWFYFDNFKNGFPTLKSLFWVGVNQHNADADLRSQFGKKGLSEHIA